MKVSIHQINSILGDFEANAQCIVEEINEAQTMGSHLAIFPEAALFGYPPADLLERPDIVDVQLKQLRKIQAQLPNSMKALIGCISVQPNRKGRPFYNSAVLLSRTAKPRFFHKQLLPVGDVFDESRFIEPGDLSKNFFSLKGCRVLVSICEDIWGWPQMNGRSAYRINPMAEIKDRADLVVNMSASPYWLGKSNERRRVVGLAAKQFSAPVIYVNSVGGQDELVFDGSSFVVNERGRVLADLASFASDRLVVSWTKQGLAVEHPRSNLGNRRSKGESSSLREDCSAELFSALVLGLKDFLRKTGITRAHLGLSGGVDSALVAALAKEAIGPENLALIAMPGPFSSQESLELATQLGRSLGVRLIESSIVPEFNLMKSKLKKFAGRISPATSLAEENLQARLRAVSLMIYANLNNSLLLSTGNKSELATGFTTLYGDLCGGLSPIGDLTKAQVYSLCRWYNREREIIPARILDREPTAELRANQKDSDSLPPYERLDQAVEALIQNQMPARSEIELWLLKKVYETEFKRWQAPPILKVSKHSFGRGRRWPIAHGLSKVLGKKGT